MTIFLMWLRLKKNSISLLLIFFSMFSISCCYAVTVGDPYGGGTVFCVSQTADTTQCVPTGSGCYGLIMANEDQVNYDSNASHGVSWSSVYSITGATFDDNGVVNTAIIIAALPGDNASNNAAWLSHNYRDQEGHTDWYLPAKNELNKMYLYANANSLIGSGCTGSKAGGVQCLVGGTFDDDVYNVYWSSTEYSGDTSGAWGQYFSNGDQGYLDKIHYYFGARAIRALTHLTTKQLNNFTKSGSENSAITFTATDFSATSCDGAIFNLASIKIVSLSTYGILKLLDIDVTLDQEIEASSLGNLTYSPNNGFIGKDSFIWNGSDGIMYAASDAKVNLNISDQPPTITNITKSGYQNTDITFTANDFIRNFNGYSGNSLTMIKILSLPINGTLKLESKIVAIDQEISLNSLNDLTFTPNPGWNGATSFIWNGSDDYEYSTNNALVDITISAVGGSAQDPIFFTDPIGYCKKNWAPCAGASFGAGSFTVALVTGVIGTCIKYKQYKLNRIHAAGLSPLEQPLLGGVYEVLEGAAEVAVARAAEEAAADAIEEVAADAAITATAAAAV